MTRGGGGDDERVLHEPEPTRSSVGPAPSASQRAVGLVAALSVAQRNVAQAMQAGLEAQFQSAKEEQVRAYHALLAYIRELEERVGR